MSIYDYEFSIGKADYEVDMEGSTEPEEKPSSDSAGSPAMFLPEKIIVYPMSLIDFVDDLRDLKFNWEMLWLESEASLEDCMKKWESGCSEALSLLLDNGLRDDFLQKIFEGRPISSESLTRLFAESGNTEPSLFIDYSIGDFITRVKDSYFPRGGKKLENEIFQDIEERVLYSSDPEDSEFDYRDF